MNRRANGIGRNEQNAQGCRRGIKPRKPIPEITALVSAYSLRVGDSAEAYCPRARSHRARELQCGSCDARQTGPLGRITGKPAQQRGGPRGEKIRQQTRPFVNILPSEQNKILLEYALN